MTHPPELDAYALGDLDAAAAGVVEAHLEVCRRCRSDVRRLREGVVLAAAALPPVTPDQAVRARTLAVVRPHLERLREAADAASERRAPATRDAARPPAGNGATTDAARSAAGNGQGSTPPEPRPVAATRPRAAAGAPRGRAASAWRAVAVALTALVVVAAGTLLLEGRRALRAVESERALVAAWLTRDDVVRHTIPARADAERSPGSVMVAADGVVLIVLRSPPPAGHSYGVWGHRDDGSFELARTTGTVVRVDAAGYRELGVSLDPGPYLGRVPLATAF